MIIQQSNCIEITTSWNFYHQYMWRSKLKFYKDDPLVVMVVANAHSKVQMHTMSSTIWLHWIWKEIGIPTICNNSTKFWIYNCHTSSITPQEESTEEASLIMIWLFKIDNNLIIESSISTNLPSGVSASYGIHFLNCSVEEWTAYHFSHAPMNSNTMGTFMMVLCYRLKLFFCFHDWERLTMIAQYHRQIRVKHFEWITDLNFATKFSYIVPLRNNSQSFFLDDFVGKRKCCKDFHSQLSKLHSFSSSCFFSIFLQISNSLNPWTISLSLSCIFIVRMGYIDLGLTQLILLFYWVITTKLRNSQNAPVLQ